MEDDSEASEQFREEDFRELCDHLGRLSELAELARNFRYEGLRKNELKKLIDLVVEAIKHSVGEGLSIVRRLQWFREVVDRLPFEGPFSPRGLKERLPRGPVLPTVFRAMEAARQTAAPLLGLPPPPPPPTPWEVADELDALIDGFTNELQRHVRLLVNFFKVMSPESIPWIIKFVEKNPGHVRASLGEALCIWWLGGALGNVKEVWRNARGPAKINGVEVDAVSATKKGFAVAEVKISKNLEELEGACRQVVRAAEKLKEPGKLKQIGFGFVGEALNPLEVAVVTLYDLKDCKERVRGVLERLLNERGMKATAAVYDVNDVKEALKRWRSKAEKRYSELFEILAKILETTSETR